MPIGYFWEKSYSQIYQNLHVTYFEDGETEFKVNFQRFLSQVSRNRDRNSQKMAKNPSSDFMTRKHILSLIVFIEKIMFLL